MPIDPTTAPTDPPRRRLLNATAAALVSLPLGAASSSMAEAATATPPRPVAGPLPVRQVTAGLLDVGYAEAGRPTVRPVLLLHGWPYDIHSFVDVAPLLAARGYRVIVPYLRGYGTHALPVG